MRNNTEIVEKKVFNEERPKVLGVKLADFLLTGLDVLIREYPPSEEDLMRLPIELKSLEENLSELRSKLSQMRSPQTVSLEKIQSINNREIKNGLLVEFEYLTQRSGARFATQYELAWSLDSNIPSLTSHSRISVGDFEFVYNPSGTFGIETVPIRSGQKAEEVLKPNIPYVPVLTIQDRSFLDIDKGLLGVLKSLDRFI